MMILLWWFPLLFLLLFPLEHVFTVVVVACIMDPTALAAIVVAIAIHLVFSQSPLNFVHDDVCHHDLNLQNFWIFQFWLLLRPAWITQHSHVWVHGNFDEDF